MFLLLGGGLFRAALWLVHADNTAQTLPFAQNWTTTTLITANDNWNGVPGIVGFLGQDITTSTGVDPQTLLTVSALANDLDVIANQSNPNTLANGGVAEFDGIANPTIALNGSGTADAPYILINLNTAGRTNITVAYNLRDLDGSVDNAISPVALQFRVGSSGNFTNVPAGFIADATTGPSLATLVTPVNAMLPAAADNQALVQVRVITSNAAGNDEWIGVDDISITGTSSPTPSLSIDDVAVVEGDSGTTTATFTLSLSVAAGPGGVTFDIATQDNSAMVSDNDYVALNLTGQTIASGNSSRTFAVTVNGDLTVEPNETFFVNVTNVVGAGVADGQGLGTITNDDVTITPIHDIQGAGASSPLAGSVLTTSGIVTAIKAGSAGGFFVQAPDAGVDANPNTSEGIFVFTGNSLPSGAVVGNSVLVTGTVQEFIPSSDPNSPPATEIAGSPSVTVLSTGNPLPAAVTLTAADTSPAGTIEQLERFEGMRVRVDSLTVVAPTQGNVSEANATSTSNGVFYGVITGIARPFREPGVELPDPLPTGSPCCVPRFDANPEKLRVDSDGQVGAMAIEVTAGAVVTNLVGPLDYGFRAYTILPDPSTPPSSSGNISAVPVPIPAGNEFTVASFNVERFFDTVNDPAIGEPVLTTTAFNNRLNKASLAIRNVMRTPDIIGVEELENLSTLQAVATKVNNDAVAAGDPNPNYQAYLFEGNDSGGIDVGLLVKSARVMVLDVTQVGKTDAFINPNTGLPETLNDRPPLVLRATIAAPSGSSAVALTVIVNHLRSLSGIDDPADGNRVRAKRRAQAEFLANLIQSRQAADPNEKIISIGDYNAFQFNDGYVDIIGTVKGTPTAASEAVLASSDLVSPDLVDLIDSATADQRYSFSFDGNAQALDHELVNPSLFSLFSKLAYARNDADFPETFRNDPNRPERLSDHDMPVAYFMFPPASADLSITKTDSPDPVVSGSDITYTIDVSNNGPDPALNVTVADAIPANTTFKSMSAPPGWSCITPSVGDSGTVTCMLSSLAPGTARFTLVVTVGCSVADGTIIGNESTVSSATGDPDMNDLSAMASTVVSNPAPMVTCPANVSVSTALNQCSAVVNYTVTASDNCDGVAVVSSPPSGSSFPKGTTNMTATATDSGGRTSSCSFTVTVTDNQPPSIVCPSDIIALTARPGQPSVAVLFPSPAFSDNCPGVLLSCAPASGSAFALGTTTVGCTATDTSGNSAMCSFTVTVFDVSIQEEGPSGKLLFNSSTGEYLICCDGTRLSGRGTATRRGCTFYLQDAPPGWRLIAVATTCANTGTATLQLPPGRPKCQIRDRDIRNNTPGCGAGT